MMLKYGFEYFGCPFLLDHVCSGYTPLHNAAAEGKDEICEILLKKRADVNAKNVS
jgi:hypothetical protein